MANAQGIKAGRAYVELGLGDKLTAGLKRAQERLKAFGAGVTTWGTRIFAAGSAVAGPALAAAKTFASMGDAVAKAAKRTGMGTEAFSELGYAAELSGTDVETLEGSIRKMQKAIAGAAGGSKEAQDALAGLGMSAEVLKELSPEQQFTVLAEAVSRIANPAERATAAMEVFGKSGAMLLPMFEKGAAGLAEMRQEARRLGLSVGGEDAEAAERLSDSFDRLWRVLKGVTFQVGAALAPALSDLLEKAATWAASAIVWIRQNQGLVVSLAKLAAGVVAAGAALIGVGKTIAIFSALFGAATTVVGALLSPIGLVVAAVGALGGYLLYATGAGGTALDWLGGKFAVLKDDATAAYEGISAALAKGDLGLAAKVAWAAIKLEWERGVMYLTQLWIAFRDGFADTMKSLGPILAEVGVRIVRTLGEAGARAGSALFTALTNYGKISGIKEATIAGMDNADRDYARNTERLVNGPLRRGSIDKATAAKRAALVMAEHTALLEDLQKLEDKAIAKVYAEAEGKGKTLGQALSEIWSKALPALDTRTMEDRMKGVGLSPEDIKRLADLEEQKRQAEAELAKLSAQAQEPGAAGEAGGPGRLKGPGDMADLWDAVSGLNGTLLKAVSTSGTFNPAGAFGLATGHVVERIAKGVEDTAANTRAILGEVRDGPVVA